jgi:AcrR family transcriptional regulator
MRYPANHSAEVRDKLVRAGASLAKKDGFARSGVDALARAADVTSGAFYKQFNDKAELFEAIVVTELETTRARFAMIEPRNEAQVLFAVDMYLSLGHVRHPEAGCVLPTLAAEIARAPEGTRAAFERALGELTAVLAEKIGDAQTASAIVSLCAGAVMVARALASDEAKRAVLGAARESARAMIATVRR